MVLVLLTILLLVGVLAACGSGPDLEEMGEDKRLGFDLEQGAHELKFRARFSLNQQQIEVWSNTIMLAVQ